MAQTATAQRTGKVVQVIGPVIDIEFPEGLPEIYNAVRIVSEGGPGVEKIDVVAEVEQHLGENRVRTVAMKPTDGMTRGMTAIDTGAPISVPVGPETLGRVLNVLGEPVDFPDRPGAVEGALADSPPRADARAAVDRAADVRDRHQGHRPARAVPAGRQDRPVRRRRRRQDRHHHGADQQHRHEARRRVGVRRRRRTHARRQRPLARVPGVGRHRHEGHVEVARGAGLRPDDGAAGRAPARRPVGAHRRRVLPRRRRQGRAALHRQHLPLHAGGLGSVGAARPHAVGRRLPADAADRDGRAAGAHHLDEEGLDHLGAGDLRARRRLHRPGAGDDVRAPRRDDEPVAADRRARHLPGRRSAGVDVAHSRPARPRRGALRRRARR